MTYELFIQHGTALYYPPVVDGVTIEWDRKGQPGKLSFEVVKTDALNFAEGDACRFSVDGTPLFFGFVFEKSRQGSNPKQIKVTVYDQLYYLKNKDYFQYENKTATEVVKMLAEDFGLNLGTLEDTGYKIPGRTEDNKTLFDIIQNALDDTLKAKTTMYVLYDKAGKLTLSNIANMKVGLVINEETAGDYDYKTSIADNTYNKIRLFREGQAPVTVKDAANIRQWGVLQYVEKVDDESVNLSNMASALLKLYNEKTRTLTVKNALGDTRIRAGTLLVVVLGLGDINVSNFLLVEQVKHSFKDNEHLMELKLRGDGFVA
ncbi:MAG: hydrolase [Oscillospiraceae bacterium]|nr:hydrolase [Oscillospiraceae bacterium]